MKLILIIATFLVSSVAFSETDQDIFVQKCVERKIKSNQISPQALDIFRLVSYCDSKFETERQNERLLRILRKLEKK